MTYVVSLSPSEHGDGANKCKKAGCYEDKHTRPIADACAKYLRKAGIKVVIAKKGTSMATRCTESDKARADLHIPIHTNASSDTSARYLLFMFIDDNSTYRKIFNAVRKPLEKIYPENLPAKYSVRKDLFEINVPRARTLYCELGFHTNKTDCDKFIHDSEAVGKALAEGICDYFGVDFNGEEQPKQTKIIEEDGLWGQSTTRFTQIVLGLSTVDGIVSNQLNSCKKYLPNMLAVSWEFQNIARGGSPTIKALQKLVGAEQDGYMGIETVKALQRFLKKLSLYNGAIDGIAGEMTVIAWQKYLNMKSA